MESLTRVLIVEDETLISELLYGLLEDLGCTVVGKAADGQQAIAMVGKLVGTPSQPDVILMDIAMPRVSGIEAAQRIQGCCPTPIVILTAYETPDLIGQASAAGAGAYLLKPPNARELERAMTIARARFADLIELRRLNAELQTRNAELEIALAQVKTLSGLLPICAHCKKIRDDHGYWQQVEVYLRDHSEAEFSHALCPDCYRELYPPEEYPFLYDKEDA